ncbi:MAG: hypothetical protein J6V48_00905 [Clostridia bacterium]|nr:hypothetical protein [Clostridia bacterium]MBP5269522.1 hypothetical protein [Clostridia bacterium]
MKKALSLILSAIMVLGMLTVFASAAGIDYAAKNDGDVLYEVDFRGNDGIYSPFVFRAGSTALAEATFVPSEDGKTLVGTATTGAAGAVFFGGKFAGLKVGGGRQYTISFKASFPANNAGMYYNIADISKTEGYDPTKDQTFNSMYGLYGTIKSGNCMTMSWGAGGKFNGEKVSSADAYTPLPEGVAADGDGFVDVDIKIDDDFYSVWFNGKLYDQSFVSDSAYAECGELGFTIYLYNKGVVCTVKNVVVKKGCDYKKSNSVKAPTTGIDYAAAKFGAKLADLLFDGSNPSFKPYFVQKVLPQHLTTDISADGKSIYMTIAPKPSDSESKGARWYGGDIGNLKITDDTKYTFTYKEKDAGSSYAGAVAHNCVRFAENAVNRFNWYGVFSGTDYKAVPTVKFAYNGTNFTGYNYTDEPMKVFNAITPVLDADGYTDIAVELDGWKWTMYMTDANQGGKLVPVQTVDVKALATDQTHPISSGDNLAFMIYIYNANVQYGVKDAAVYKGLTISETYPDDTQTGTPTTGDAAIWFAVVGAVALLGMGVAVKTVKSR